MEVRTPLGNKVEINEQFGGVGRHTKFLGSSVGLEHLTVNQRVRGSNPRRGAKKSLDGNIKSEKYNHCRLIDILQFALVVEWYTQRS